MSFAQGDNDTTAEIDDSSTYSAFKLEVEGKNYDIQYRIHNGTLDNIETNPPRGASLDLSITSTDKGMIIIKLPRELADKISNIGTISAYINTASNVDYEEQVTCEYRTFLIAFPDGARKIKLLGSRVSTGGGEGDQDYNPMAGIAQLAVEAEGKTFAVETNSNSKICGWQFIPDEKKLRINLMAGAVSQIAETGLPSNRSAGMGITIPNELLGGPYIVTIDGSRIEENVVIDSSTETHTIMHFSYGNDAQALEIVGTTAIPEFNSMLFLTLLTSSIVAVFVFMLRLFPGNNDDSLKSH